MKQPVVSRAPATWIAEADGIAHARSHRPATRTACGIPAIDIRYAWPARTRCGVCVVVLEEVATA
jgi:hypothetical protein